MPSGVTMSTSSPSTITVPVRFCLSGAVFATCSAYSGAASAITTSSRKTPENTSASRSRRRRRQASSPRRPAGTADIGACLGIGQALIALGYFSANDV